MLDEIIRDHSKARFILWLVAFAICFIIATSLYLRIKTRIKNAKHVIAVVTDTPTVQEDGEGGQLFVLPILFKDEDNQEISTKIKTKKRFYSVNDTVNIMYDRNNPFIVISRESYLIWYPFYFFIGLIPLLILALILGIYFKAITWPF